MFFPPRMISSNWPKIRFKREPAVWITASAFTLENKNSALSVSLTPKGSGRPRISPRSRPTISLAMSTAPTISISDFVRIRFAVARPMGPRPYWMTLVFFVVIGNLPFFLGYFLVVTDDTPFFDQLFQKDGQQDTAA